MFFEDDPNLPKNIKKAIRNNFNKIEDGYVIDEVKYNAGCWYVTLTDNKDKINQQCKPTSSPFVKTFPIYGDIEDLKFKN